MRNTSYTPAELVCSGADFIDAAGFPRQHVAADWGVGVYSPAWAEANKTPDALAYACYSFDMEGYNRVYQIAFSWLEQGAAGDMWIGLADFTRDTWSWRVLPENGILACNLTPYIDTETHTMLVLPLAIGNAAWRLKSIHVGDLTSLSGFVVREDGTSPLYNAEVVVSGAQQYATRTDPQGAWSIHGVLPGSYTVTAYAVGWQFTPAQQDFTVSGLEQAIPNFQGSQAVLHKLYGSVVAYPDNAPLFGAGIEIKLQESPYGSIIIWSDTAGAWETAVPDGKYRIQPMLKGWDFVPRYRNFTVSGADSYALRFTGEQLPGYKLDGYVCLADGSTPVSGVLITAEYGELGFSYTTQSGEDGYWSIDGVPSGDLTIEPYKYDWLFDPEIQEISIEEADYRADPFVGTQRVQCDVGGFIYLADGVTGVPDIVVVLTDGFYHYYTTTAYSGGYLYQYVMSGEYTVTPQSALYTFEPAAQSLTVTDGIIVDPFTATRKPGSTVSGHIYGADGSTGLEDVMVEVSYWGPPAAIFLYATSGPDGYWEVADVPNGTFTVTPLKQDYTFDPVNREIEVLNAPVAVDDFIGSLQP